MTDWANPVTWYDVLIPWGPSDDFYLDLVMSAGCVLDVGCGTGTLLHRARDGGRFAFETRHLRARAWERWNTSVEARNPEGDVVARR